MLPPTLDVVDLTGTKVLIADDVADTGKTLELVQRLLRRPRRRGPHRGRLREAAVGRAAATTRWKRTDALDQLPVVDAAAGRSRGGPGH